MASHLHLKVCGLTSGRDAAAADAVGAEFLGFIFHDASPRRITREGFREFAAGLPARKKVAVIVEPSEQTLRTLKEDGFDHFQVHVRLSTPLDQVAAWSRRVGPESLWLAPKLPPGVDVPPEFLPLASTFLLDTFDPVKFGGTGRTGDWAKFSRHQQAHPDKTWILSGGLDPDNLASAVKASGALFVDINSGVESEPGIKDPAKLGAVRRSLDELGGSQTE